MPDLSQVPNCNNLLTSANENILQDFNDAVLCMSNEFFPLNPACLKLILHQDAFKVVNILSSAKCKHKLIGVYMTLANLHPHNQSKVAQSQLVQLFKKKKRSQSVWA